MTSTLELLLILLVLMNLTLMGSGRLKFVISVVAVQGFIVSLLPFFTLEHGIGPRIIGLAILTIAVKSIVFPWLLNRALRRS